MAVVRAELFKLLRRPGVVIILLIWPLLSFGFGYLIPFLIRNMEEVQAELGDALTESLLPAEFVANAVGGFPLFGFALALVLGSLAVGSEFSWGTLATTLVQGPTRTAVHLGRTVTLIALAGVMTLSVVIVAALTSALIALILSEPMDWPDVGLILRGVGGGWLILSVATVLGATLAMVLRSTALAIGLGLVYVLIVESVFTGFASSADWVRIIASGLPGVNAGGLAASLQRTSAQNGAPGVQAIVDGTRATITLAIYLAVLTVSGELVFRRRDVAG